MKRSSDFLLREVAGATVIVPVGAAASTFPGMISVNATGAYLWEQLETEQTEQTLVQALTERYDVDEEKALVDVKTFVARLRPTGAIV